jgi:hypothetical protein
MGKDLKVGDEVRVLPNKGDGVILDISSCGFVIVRLKKRGMKRPYMPFQLEKIGEEKCLEE